MDARAYYNEHDKFAAAWLRNLIAAGHIAPGDVDERDIRDVQPDDLAGYTQCHFFAGIGVWSHGLRRAGWPDRRPVWTASCPCQPFSSAGAGAGFADERHLWPSFFHLVEQCRPRECFGEQVASKDGLAWLDLVQSDMEGTGYTFGALDLCAAGFGAPHIRQRLYWLAYAEGQRRSRLDGEPGDRAPLQSERSRVTSGLDDSLGDGRRAGRNNNGAHDRLFIDAAGSIGGLADDDEHGSQGRALEAVLGAGRRQEGDAPGRSGASLAGELADAYEDGLETPPLRQLHDPEHHVEPRREAGGPSPTNGSWRAADWLLCRDGKWRPVEPGTFPLAHGAASRVGRLRAYGNAIVATQAEEFIGAYLDAEAEHIRLSSGVFA